MGGKPGRLFAAVAVVIVAAVGVGGYAVYSHLRPYLYGSSCEAKTAEGTVPLDLDQASNASTVAAVAFRKRLPEQAVVVAYATAMQESHLYNLPFGDRDSVGLFQQRPSQGWGTADQLTDPVYATNRFFDALVKVKGYADQPVEEAAQQVQRSADGGAYARHEAMAKVMADAFTGRAPGGVHCWYPPDKRKPTNRADAMHELRRAFGPLSVEADTILAASARSGWAAAIWTVTHAQVYGLASVRYAGRQWTADDGHNGWTPDTKATKDRVAIR